MIWEWPSGAEVGGTPTPKSRVWLHQPAVGCPRPKDGGGGTPSRGLPGEPWKRDANWSYFGGAWGQNKPEWGPQGPGHTGGPRVPHLRESLGRVQTRNPHRVGGWPRDGDQSPQGCPEGWPGGRAPLDVTGAINGPRELEFREPIIAMIIWHLI